MNRQRRIAREIHRGIRNDHLAVEMTFNRRGHVIILVETANRVTCPSHAPNSLLCGRRHHRTRIRRPAFGTALWAGAKVVTTGKALAIHASCRAQAAATDDQQPPRWRQDRNQNDQPIRQNQFPIDQQVCRAAAQARVGISPSRNPEAADFPQPVLGCATVGGAIADIGRVRSDGSDAQIAALDLRARGDRPRGGLRDSIPPAPVSSRPASSSPRPVAHRRCTFNLPPRKLSSRGRRRFRVSVWSRQTACRRQSGRRFQRETQLAFS